MGRALILLTAVIAVAQVSAAESAYLAPQPGTMVTWQYQFGDEGYIQLGEVVAAGDDFAIYNPDISNADTAPSNYLVEFSGLHSQRCDEPMPTARDRAALAAVWPLTEGASATVLSGIESSYRVQGIGEGHSVSDLYQADRVREVEVVYGSVAMTLSVAPELGMSVGVDWPTGDYAAVLEVIEPQGSAAPADADTLNLGRCGELLQ